jgi:RimJ/RimL family protein N-acetyltransferase
MNLQPTLQNDLILLRPLETGDYSDLFEVASDPQIWEQHPQFDRYEEEKFQVYFQSVHSSKAALVIIDKRSDKIIGCSRFKILDESNLEIEIGWTFLSRDYWGGVYNGSIKELMIDHILSAAQTVVFKIDETNIRSRKAVEKIGAILVTDEHISSKYSDKDSDCIYLIQKGQWLNRNK